MHDPGTGDGGKRLTSETKFSHCVPTTSLQVWLWEGACKHLY